MDEAPIVPTDGQLVMCRLRVDERQVVTGYFPLTIDEPPVVTVTMSVLDGNPVAGCIKIDASKLTRDPMFPEERLRYGPELSLKDQEIRGI